MVRLIVTTAGLLDGRNDLMRLLVTGVREFIGSRPALTVKDAGHSVLAEAIVDTPTTAASLVQRQRDGSEVGVGIIDVLTLAPGAMEGVDVAIHLAAAQHETNVPGAHFHRVNVTGAARSLVAARRPASADLSMAALRP